MRFRYGLLRRGGREAGIVPVFVADVPVEAGASRRLRPMLSAFGRLAPAFSRVRTLFVGSPTSVAGTIGLLPGIDRADAVRAIARALETLAVRERATATVWKDFPGPEEAAYELLVADHGFVAMRDFPGTTLALPATWKGYLGSLPGRRRYRLRKKLRQSHAFGPLETSIARTPDAGTLAEIYGLYRQTFERAANQFEELTLEFFARVSGLETARFVLLRDPQTSKLVAFMLCFFIGSRAINRFVGLDYAVLQSWNLHFRLWEEAVRFMIESGATEVHSGPTAYRFKMDTGHHLVPMTTYVKHRNRFVQRFIAPLIRDAMARTNWSER